MQHNSSTQHNNWQSIPKLLGFPHPVSNGALYPGAERERLLGYLLARLLYPASLESVLSKLIVSPPAGTSIEECSLDEQLSQSEETCSFFTRCRSANTGKTHASSATLLK